MRARKLSLGRWGCSAVLFGAAVLVPSPSLADEAAASASVSTSGVSASSSGIGSVASGDSDHAKFVGSFAVGYLGASLVPFATNAAVQGNPGQGVNYMTADGATVYAPVIGVRYWLNDMLGIDGGLGFRRYSGTFKEHRADWTNNNTLTERDYEYDDVSQMGFLLHAGVPLALNTDRHFVFEVVPEANVGLSSGTIKDQPYVPAGQAGPPNTIGDIKLSGFRFDIGARVGTELHFGFIGVPNLSLQAGVGLYFSMEKYKADGGSYSDPNNAANSRPNTSIQGSRTTISTSVNNDPWAIFTNNVSALYYF